MLLMLLALGCGDDLAQTEQFRTDVEAVAAGSVRVDLKAQSSPFHKEIDDAAGCAEAVGFSYGQDAGWSQAGQDLGDIPTLRTTDEEQVAGVYISESVESFDHDCVTLDAPTPRDFVERVAEWVCAQNADADRGVWLGERRGRPLHEHHEVDEECRLDLIFLAHTGFSERGKPGGTAKADRCQDEWKQEQPPGQATRRAAARELKSRTVLDGSR